MIKELTDEELSAVTSLIRARYGYDFTDYAQASLKRRVLRFMDLAKVSLFDLKHHLTNDRVFFLWMLESLTVNVTEMFRDPEFFAALRTEVLPKLATYPFIRIWHAGCSTGEEVFSMAIMLEEAGLLHRSRIYATDMNTKNLERANAGTMPIEHMAAYTENYRRSGGKQDFANYYSARYNEAIINSNLRKNIFFSQHNLVSDQVFNEFQLIICRNVLIYFKRDLQNRVIRLFSGSLAPRGFLAIGTKESLWPTNEAQEFDTLDGINKIYRLKL